MDLMSLLGQISLHAITVEIIKEKSLTVQSFRLIKGELQLL